MRDVQRSILSIFLLLISLQYAIGQDDAIAYATRSPRDRMADSGSVGFTEGPVSGTVDLMVPDGTHRIDLLDANGNVRFTFDPLTQSTLDLDRLRTGVWSIRAHGPNGILVRRFVMEGNGNVRWLSYPRLAKVRR